MQVVGVRPRLRPMKERTHRIVGIGHVGISEDAQRSSMRVEWLQRVDRELNVDDRLGGQARDRSRAVVIDPSGERAERMREPVAFGLERSGPRRDRTARSPDGRSIRHDRAPKCVEAVSQPTWCPPLGGPENPAEVGRHRLLKPLLGYEPAKQNG